MSEIFEDRESQALSTIGISSFFKILDFTDNTKVQESVCPDTGS
jgi:hypothetical protein